MASGVGVSAIKGSLVKYVVLFRGRELNRSWSAALLLYMPLTLGSRAIDEMLLLSSSLCGFMGIMRCLRRSVVDARLTDLWIYDEFRSPSVVGLKC